MMTWQTLKEAGPRINHSEVLKRTRARLELEFEDFKEKHDDLKALYRDACHWIAMNCKRD